MSLEEKLETTTTIPKKTFEHLHKHINLIHSDDVLQALNNLNQYEPISIDFFEGILYIQLDIDDNIKYKFIPNEEFNNIITSTIKNKQSDLSLTLKNKLKQTLINTYKDLF